MLNGQDASLSIECKVIKAIELTTHTMFIGEALAMKTTEEQPLAYHQGSYWKLSETLPKPTEKERAKQKAIMDQFKR